VPVEHERWAFELTQVGQAYLQWILACEQAGKDPDEGPFPGADAFVAGWRAHARSLLVSAEEPSS